MIRFKSFANSLLLIFCFSGCIVDPPFVPDFPIAETEGYRPIYATAEESLISFTGPQSLTDPGKIYVIGDYLLINEYLKGIHVYNNADPSNPIALGFLQVRGNTEIAVRNNTLYVDHMTDLVALDVTNWNAVREISRIEQAHWIQDFPPQGGRYFECVDTKKGIVIGWELTTIKNPKCFR